MAQNSKSNKNKQNKQQPPAGKKVNLLNQKIFVSITPPYLAANEEVLNSYCFSLLFFRVYKRKPHNKRKNKPQNKRRKVAVAVSGP